MSLRAYAAVQNATESPRSVEYRLFAQVTRSLLDIGPAIDSTAHEALYWNRQLWITLQKDLAHENNGLPDQLKAGLISLAIWVDRYTTKVIRGEAEVAPLIQVNRSIMEGLGQRP